MPPTSQPSKSPAAPPFVPAPGLRNGHLQTLFSRSVYTRRGIIFHRRRLETADGDFIDLDFPELPGFSPPPAAPLVLLLHGLEGSARSRYALESYAQLGAVGIRAAGMNFRSCSGELNRTERFYHAGETDDIRFVWEWLDRQFPAAKKGIIGFSLGANMLLKLLGEWGSTAPDSLRCAAAVSPPFDLISNSYKMAQGFNRLYAAIFLHELRQKVRAKEKILESIIDIPDVLASKTLREFDERCTAPLNGFRSADDYYHQTSSRRFLKAIETPTLLIRALDDPLFTPRDVPYNTIGENRYLQSLFPRHGGHVAFIQGRPGAYRRWAERTAARFFKQYLLSDPAP